MVHRRDRLWLGLRGDASEFFVGIAEDALGIGSVEWKSREELGGHAAALASVEAAATCASASRLWFSEGNEEIALSPNMLEASYVSHVAGFEFVMNHEWAGVHVADGIDETHDSASTAKVESR